LKIHLASVRRIAIPQGHTFEVAGAVATIAVATIDRTCGPQKFRSKPRRRRSSRLFDEAILVM